MSTRNLADEDLTNAVLASFAGRPRPSASRRSRRASSGTCTRSRREVAADRGGVVRGDRLPHPHGPHHRRQAPGVRAALRRARALDAGRRDQQPAPARGHGVDGLRPVLRRGLARTSTNGDDIAEARQRRAVLHGRAAWSSVDGEPVAGARIEVWQADEDGFYDVQYADLDEPRGRGHLFTDDDGRFWFWSVKPEAYPIPADGPVGELLDGGRARADAPRARALQGHRRGLSDADHPRVRRGRRVPGLRRRVRRAQRP